MAWDFGANALYYDVIKQEIVDFTGGYADIARKAKDDR